MEDYYHIFWSIMLTQIFVASSSEIILWFIFAMVSLKAYVNNNVISSTIHAIIITAIVKVRKIIIISYNK